MGPALLSTVGSIGDSEDWIVPSSSISSTTAPIIDPKINLDTTGADSIGWDSSVEGAVVSVVAGGVFGGEGCCPASSCRASNAGEGVDVSSTTGDSTRGSTRGACKSSFAAVVVS